MGSDTRDPSLESLNISDRRAAIRREELERATERQERLASQSSPLNTPEQRIQIWERLHSVSLPRSASHSLVRVIATQTGLSVPEVHQEQRHRAGLTDAVPSSDEGTT